jgi:IS30 family transposase
MSKEYKHLSLEQRYKIEALLKVGLTQKAIADHLEVCPSTISRELKRNIPKRGKGAKEYNAGKAQSKTKFRHKDKRKQVLFTDAMKEIAFRQLREEKWSPAIISAVGKRDLGYFVSHERLYQWIWDCKHQNKRADIRYKTIYRYLRHGKRRRKRGLRNDSRGTIVNRVPISERPKVVVKRKRYGDIETDLMMGKDHKGALLVMTDRATLHTHLKLLPDKNSTTVWKAIVSKLRRSKGKLHTMTFDNDKAFSAHEIIANKLNLDTYFTRPYTSQDKGTVENRIGVIRRFFPKKTNLNIVTEKMVKEVERKINNRPVKKFNHLTPNNVLQKKLHL